MVQLLDPQLVIISCVLLRVERHPLCEEFEGDVLDPASLQAACAGCWAVVSCVGADMLAKVPFDQIFRPIGAFCFQEVTMRQQCIGTMLYRILQSTNYAQINVDHASRCSIFPFALFAIMLWTLWMECDSRCLWEAGDGMELLFAAARDGGAVRLVVLSSLNSDPCRSEFEARMFLELNLSGVLLLVVQTIQYGRQDVCLNCC